jgi:beta-phosphoglucomutase
MRHVLPGVTVDVIVTGEDVKNGKPDPEVYNIAKEKLGVTDNSEVLVFEDSEVGIKAANNAGIVNVIKIKI